MTIDEAGEKVSLIVPTVKAPCVWCSLAHIALTCGTTRELIVVADQPSEKKLRLFSRFQATVIANNSPVGAPHAFNQGLKMATRQYIIMLNDDILPMSGDWFVPMVEALDRHPEFGMVAPRVIRPWSEDKVWYAAIGEGAMMTREMIDRVGYFDEDPIYKGLGTDGDYFARCVQAGYKFHGIPQSLIIHNSGQTIAGILTDDYCRAVTAHLKAKWGDLPDQHILPEYKGEAV